MAPANQTATQIVQVTYTDSNTFTGSIHTDRNFDADGTLTVDGAATFNGAVTLGNAAGDAITITGAIAADIDMNGNGLHDVDFIATNNVFGLFLDGGVVSLIPKDWAGEAYDCQVDLGTSSASYLSYYGKYSYATAQSAACDLAELQFTEEECGTIVELSDWENKEEKEEFETSIEECKSKKDCEIRFYGYQGRWKKAGVRSIKCPSIVSTVPGLIIGSDERRRNLYHSGKMNYIALSGSVPNVFVIGKFNSGDIIISAGEGNAMVDNNAPWNQAIGYCKRSGENERCEIWVR